LNLLRFQAGAIYFFGGLAKVNHDWLRGEPMRSWLLAKSANPLISFITANKLELAMFSYGGLLFDLLVVPALLWRRTRPFAFAAAIIFHSINSQLFQIGIFPWMMLAATTLFFAPDWPRRFLRRAIATASVGAEQPRQAVPLMALLGAYAALQIFLPLRHFLYDGNVSWTEEGHRFAWHMKLRDKDGRVQFFVKDRRSGQTVAVQPDAELADWQVAKLATRPDMILQYAHHLAEARGGSRNVEVHARALVSLNGGGVRPLVDERANLAAEPRTLATAWWITRGEDESLAITPDTVASAGNQSVRIR
jgi:hypothetical protein